MTPALLSFTITPEKFCCAAFGRHHALPPLPGLGEAPAAPPTATVLAEAKDPAVDDPDPLVDSPRPPSSKPFMPAGGMVWYGLVWNAVVVVGRVVVDTLVCGVLIFVGF